MPMEKLCKIEKMIIDMSIRTALYLNILVIVSF